MQTSIFIAKLLGPVLAVMGLAILTDREKFRRMIAEFLAGDALIFISGVITLPIGLAIVNAHNVWGGGWPLIITIFGWVSIFAGIVRITMPSSLKTVAGTLMGSSSTLSIMSALLLGLGAFLSYQGYLG